MTLFNLRDRLIEHVQALRSTLKDRSLLHHRIGLYYAHTIGQRRTEALQCLYRLVLRQMSCLIINGTNTGAH